MKFNGFWRRRTHNGLEKEKCDLSYCSASRGESNLCLVTRLCNTEDILVMFSSVDFRILRCCRLLVIKWGIIYEADFYFHSGQLSLRWVGGGLRLHWPDFKCSLIAISYQPRSNAATCSLQHALLVLDSDVPPGAMKRLVLPNANWGSLGAFKDQRLGFTRQRVSFSPLPPLCRVLRRRSSSLQDATEDDRNRIYIIGADNEGAFYACSLRSGPNPPPVTLLSQEPRRMEHFEKAGRKWVVLHSSRVDSLQYCIDDYLGLLCYCRMVQSM
jgi:hypothetical protein